MILHAAEERPGHNEISGQIVHSAPTGDPRLDMFQQNSRHLAIIVRASVIVSCPVEYTRFTQRTACAA
jgi:hypothetical protein